MGFIKRVLGIESCNGLFNYPLFMGRKKRLEALDGIIEMIEKSEKKKKCDICKKRFNESMSRWSKNSFASSICIVCHQKFWNRKYIEYMPHEQRELRKLKKDIVGVEHE